MPTGLMIRSKYPMPIAVARLRRIAALTALIAVAGCRRSDPAIAPPKPIQVIVEKPIVREVTEFEDFTGRTEAISAVELRSRVTGYLEAALFKEGADVKKGDLLFEIDPRTYKAELERAIAEVAKSKASFDRVNTDYQRALRLAKQQAVSKEEVERLGFDRAEAEAAVASAQANQSIAELNLGFTRIVAPISGRISDRLVDPGNLVQADVTPLTTIVSVDPLNVNFDVDERTMLRIRRLIAEGQIKSARDAPTRVRVGLADESGFSQTGTIDFVDNKVDANMGTLRLRAVLTNPKGILAPGLFVRLRVPIGKPRSAILVPEEAISSDQGQKFLYVVDAHNKVTYRPVRVGLLDGDLRVIESGVEPGERMIVRGLQRVRPNDVVEPTLVERPTGDAVKSNEESPQPVLDGKT